MFELNATLVEPVNVDLTETVPCMSEEDNAQQWVDPDINQAPSIWNKTDFQLPMSM